MVPVRYFISRLTANVKLNGKFVFNFADNPRDKRICTSMGDISFLQENISDYMFSLLSTRGIYLIEECFLGNGEQCVGNFEKI